MTTTVIQDITNKFRIWRMPEVFTGPTGTGIYQPKVNDLVVDFNDDATISIYRVMSQNADGTVNMTESYFRDPSTVGFGALFGDAGTAALYYDTRVSPYTIQVDGRITVASNNASYARIYRGTDTSSVGTVISQTYLADGTLGGNLLSMSTVATDKYNNNTGIRRVDKGYTAAELLQNEVVTLVIYDAAGTVILLRTLKVQPVNMIQGINTDSKFVVGISLQTAIGSVFAGNVVNYPALATFEKANFNAVVTYFSGESKILPIDGTTVTLEGLEGYVPNGVNQTYPMVLKYRLRAGESGYPNSTSSNVFSQSYTLHTIAPNPDYLVKLYAYPVWNANTAAYQLKWFLCHGTRSGYEDVTSLVTITGTPFNGTLYSTDQTVTARINLKNVSAVYGDFIYTQGVKLKLIAPGTYRSSSPASPNWLVDKDVGNAIKYGGGLFATVLPDAGGIAKINLKGLFTGQSAWITAAYANAGVILSPSGDAPVPTHFTVLTGSTNVTYPISAWNSVLSLTAAIDNSSTVFIVFKSITAQGTSVILVAGMPAYQVDASGNFI